MNRTRKSPSLMKLTFLLGRLTKTMKKCKVMSYSGKCEEEEKIRPCAGESWRGWKRCLYPKYSGKSALGEGIFELPPEYQGKSPAQIRGSNRDSECKVLGMERSLVCSEDRDKARVTVP